MSVETLSYPFPLPPGWQAAIDAQPLDNCLLTALLPAPRAAVALTDSLLMADAGGRAAVWSSRDTRAEPQAAAYLSGRPIEELYGPDGLTAALTALMPHWTHHRTALCHLHGLPSALGGTMPVSPAHPADAHEVMGLLTSIAEFGYVGDMTAETGRLAGELPRLPGVLIRHDGQVIGFAHVIFQNARYAMIGDVAVADGWRRQGCGAALMTALCRTIVDQGRIPALIYFNPQAGRLYRRLGFVADGAMGFSESE